MELREAPRASPAHEDGRLRALHAERPAQGQGALQLELRESRLRLDRRVPLIAAPREAPRYRRAVRLIALSAALVLAIAAIAMSRAPARDGLQRGFVLLGLKGDSYLRPRSDAALRRMAADGADRVAIFSQWFLADPTASALAPDPART